MYYVGDDADPALFVFPTIPVQAITNKISKQRGQGATFSRMTVTQARTRTSLLAAEVGEKKKKKSQAPSPHRRSFGAGDDRGGEGGRKRPRRLALISAPPQHERRSLISHFAVGCNAQRQQTDDSGGRVARAREENRKRLHRPKQSAQELPTFRFGAAPLYGRITTTTAISGRTNRSCNRDCNGAPERSQWSLPPSTRKVIRALLRSPMQKWFSVRREGKRRTKPETGLLHTPKYAASVAAICIR